MKRSLWFIPVFLALTLVLSAAAPRQAVALALRTIATASTRPKEDLGGLLASHPALDDRLAALEPLEAPLPLASRPSAGPAK